MICELQTKLELRKSLFDGDPVLVVQVAIDNMNE